ncbi:DHH family phosphoesterase [Pseudobacillus badius]|uniref:DHH family phosphoesterase n=1 Tax=Bacillus badius TaxID=1455 RepID=UPI0007B0C08D|nr:oligoribonuclease [Bacillus badius]KZO00706.1 oligoribonuclease [Bacillus badius]MED0667064.1 oligoribonuclease [Bacillus badius]OCS88122.1 oligoribonuclease [Bacillus badius]OVE53351.1 oligoribonuclease [Bacillus badius]TDW05699.1 oligoribonuclease NrnB/cAMP/cGMP phosphodiesterase (DHH superfamily) [Bacillus badius]
MYKLLTHNDLDGVGCGILAKLAFGKQVQVRYNSVAGLDYEVAWFLENQDKKTALFITDLSVNKDNQEKLNAFHQDGGKVQLIDHHKTALHFNEYEWGHVVIEDEDGKLTSATSLLYDYLLQHELIEPSNALAEFVELVRQYDTWEWEKNANQEARRLNALFFLVSIEEFEDRMISRLRYHQHFFFDELEEKILDMEDDKIARYIHRKRRELVQASIGEHMAGVVYAESYHSELGNELGKENPHLDYIAILNIGGKRLGFRTIHDHIDVSEVAARYGGGGHAKAAGASMTEEAYTQFVTDTFHLLPLREDARRNRYNVKESSFGSLYESRPGETFLLYETAENNWAIKRNGSILPETFPSFQTGENFLKRTFEASLARDDVFVHYLQKLAQKEH